LGEHKLRETAGLSAIDQERVKQGSSFSTKAVDVLRDQKSRQDTPTPFPVNANAFRLAWERLRKRADLGDLRFHDLRHEAISRFFEMGLSVPEVAVISGHKDARMLFRYTHLRAKTLSLNSVRKPCGTTLAYMEEDLNAK